MKKNLSIQVFFSLVCSFFALGVCAVKAEAHPAKAKKDFYEYRISKANDLHADQLEVLTNQYESALKNSAAMLQKKGNLDGLLAVKAELECLKKTGSVPDGNQDGNHVAVLKLRKIFNDSRAKSDTLKADTTTVLTNNYLAYLEDLQKKLTQSGEINKALLVKFEVSKIKKFKDNMPDMKQGVSAPSKQRSQQNNRPEIPASLILAWDQSRPGELLGPKQRVTPSYKFNHQGGNGIAEDGVLSMDGGRSVVEGLNRNFLSSCQASQQWSLVLHFETASLNQAGPARIFSSSLNGYLRNFSLCQEKEQLKLRLRTTKTGENGTNPEVKLGSIKKGSMHRIAITYQPGKLAFYMDGKTIPVQQIGGDFSNWKDYPIVLGNEWKDDRPWKGRFYRFSVYSSALTKDEALTLTQ